MEQNEENIGLDFNISGKSLLKYAFPTILSNIFMNIYGIVDSLFVSNVISTDALSALNIVWPLLSILMAFGVMVAQGGSALVAKMLGEGHSKNARSTFTFLALFTFSLSVLLCMIGFLFRSPLLRLMGADSALYPLCEQYAIPLFILGPMAFIGIIFQSFFIVAGKPRLGFGLSIAGGVINIVLDWLLIVVLDWGLTGAALATVLGYTFQSVCGFLYFLLKKDCPVRFAKPVWSGRVLLKTFGNGISEMVTMMSSSVISIVMNIILMNKVGSDGVAAAAIVINMQLILSSAYYGYSTGIAPVISYNYGKGDEDRLKKIFKTALKTLGVMSVIVFAITFPLARPMTLLYGGSGQVYDMSLQGIYAMSVAFLVMAVNMFCSSMFTALNDGKTSAIVSFFRTFIFMIIPLVILPFLLPGIWGVWVAMPLAEVMSLILSIHFFKKYKGKYGYA